MGLLPTPVNENQRCRPRESGDPLSFQWIPAFAGMKSSGGIFGKADRNCKCTWTALRFAQPHVIYLRCPKIGRPAITSHRFKFATHCVEDLKERSRNRVLNALVSE